MYPTPKQKRILDFVKDYTTQNGYPPTVREIAKALGVKSHSSIYSCLCRLKQRGLITWVPHLPRTMEAE